MSTRNPCTICGAPGIPGLLQGAGKCQYHYDVGQFGKEWADKCRVEEKKMITTQAELRAEFWAQHPRYKRVPGWTQNDYNADVRMAWCDFVEYMRRAGSISDALAQRATL